MDRPYGMWANVVCPALIRDPRGSPLRHVGQRLPEPAIQLATCHPLADRGQSDDHAWACGGPHSVCAFAGVRPICSLGRVREGGDVRPVTMTIMALLAAFTVMPGYTRQDSELDRLDLITVLPRPTELHGFAAKLQPTQRFGGPVRPHYRGAAVGQYKSARCFVTREADGLLVRVSVAVTTTASAMDELARRWVRAHAHGILLRICHARTATRPPFRGATLASAIAVMPCWTT